MYGPFMSLSCDTCPAFLGFHFFDWGRLPPGSSIAGALTFACRNPECPGVMSWSGYVTRVDNRDNPVSTTLAADEEWIDRLPDPIPPHRAPLQLQENP